MAERSARSRLKVIEPLDGSPGKSHSALLSIKAIANPRFGHDVARLGRIGFDLLAQLSDEDAQIFVLLGIVAAPDGAQQRPVRQDLARIAQQVDQQIEFLRRQMKLSPTVSDCVRVEIDAKLSGGKNPRSCVSRRL